MQNNEENPYQSPNDHQDNQPESSEKQKSDFLYFVSQQSGTPLFSEKERADYDIHACVILKRLLVFAVPKDQKPAKNTITITKDVNILSIDRNEEAITVETDQGKFVGQAEWKTDAYTTSIFRRLWNLFH